MRQRVDDARRRTACRRSVASSASAAAWRDRVAEDPRARHRVVGVGDGDDAGAERRLRRPGCRGDSRGRRRARARRGRRGRPTPGTGRARSARCPMRGCRRMSRCSSIVSGAGLRSSASGIASFPRSCRSAPRSTVATSCDGEPSAPRHSCRQLRDAMRMRVRLGTGRLSASPAARRDHHPNRRTARRSHLRVARGRPSHLVFEPLAPAP